MFTEAGSEGGFWDDIIEPANYLGIILDVMGSGMPCDVLSIIGLVYSQIQVDFFNWLKTIKILG